MGIDKFCFFDIIYAKEGYMTYSFNAELKYIFELVYNEQRRREFQKTSFIKSLDKLDELKRKNSAPVETCAELWELKKKDLLNGKSSLHYLIKLENAYIKANQYIDFTKRTIQELVNIKLQVLLVNKKAQNLEFDEYEKQYFLPVDLHDCNEAFRYVTVWDMNDFVLKCNERYKQDEVILEQIKDVNIMNELIKMGYGNYVQSLIIEYKKQLEQAQKVQKDAIKTFVETQTNVKNINKKMNYKHNLPMNYFDGSRYPIGCDNEKISNMEYKKVMAECIKIYKNKKLKHYNKTTNIVEK